MTSRANQNWPDETYAAVIDASPKPRVMKLTQASWNHIHPDFKGETNGIKYRMWDNDLVAVQIVPFYDHKRGDRVHVNGYDGSIVRRYSEGMYEVRLPGGVCCVPASDLICL